ncbi:hypothetical protein CCHR01_15381 [Colletotrichum chrysophilum]|uniref:Uncharacterized protein n=1 Tax=Colletotrichum chrysophilum TaxID=1836956 RepID=A0AAD9EEK8_9PEZI|nr:hypothetical protein CCHR01_15381 [Colletotrichum chrysophilum]
MRFVDLSGRSLRYSSSGNVPVLVHLNMRLLEMRGQAKVAALASKTELTATPAHRADYKAHKYRHLLLFLCGGASIQFLASIANFDSPRSLGLVDLPSSTRHPAPPPMLRSHDCPCRAIWSVPASWTPGSEPHIRTGTRKRILGPGTTVPFASFQS